MQYQFYTNEVVFCMNFIERALLLNLHTHVKMVIGLKRDITEKADDDWVGPIAGGVVFSL